MTTTSKPLTSAEFADQLLVGAKDMRDHPENYRGWKTGIAKLDNLIGGILKNRYYVIGGAQKSGKSATVITIAVNLNKQGVNVLYLSLEMDNFEIATRVFTNQSAFVTMEKFRDVNINNSDIYNLEQVANNVRKWHGFWDYGRSSINEIIKVIDECQVDVVIIDYFQLLETGTMKRQEALAKISRMLKLLTNRSDGKKRVTVILPSQLNRESIRSDAYDANAFLDTGSLERDCDVAMIIQDVKDDAGERVPNRRKIKVVASRVSDVGEVEVFFNGARSLVADFVPENTNRPRI